MNSVTAHIVKARDASAPPELSARWIPFDDRVESTNSFEPLSVTWTVAAASQSIRNDSDSEKSIWVSMAEQLRAERERWLRHCQHETVRLGIAIAERLLGQTLLARPETVADLMRTVLTWAVGVNQLRVRVHSLDHDILQPDVRDLHGDVDKSIELVVDDSLSRGDCVVDTPQGQIDGRLDKLLDQIATDLLADAD